MIFLIIIMSMTVMIAGHLDNSPEAREAWSPKKQLSLRLSWLSPWLSTLGCPLGCPPLVVTFGSPLGSPPDLHRRQRAGRASQEAARSRSRNLRLRRRSPVEGRALPRRKQECLGQ